MPFPIPYTNPGYTAAQSAALDLLQAVTTPIITTVIPATQSIQSPTQNIANVTAPPIIAAALQPPQSMGYIPNNIPSVAPPLVSNLVQVNPNIVDAMFQNPPYALVTRSGGGGGGGSAISSFQQLYTSSFTTSTIQTATDGYVSTFIVAPDYIVFNGGSANIIINASDTGLIPINPNNFNNVFIGDGVSLGSSNVTGGSNVAIGSGAGFYQDNDNVAIGADSGAFQSTNAIAVGYRAGFGIQQHGAIAIGSEIGLGETIQYTLATAVGFQAQKRGAGAASLALGAFAGDGNGSNAQPPSTIIMNATGASLNGITGQERSLYVAPIRNDATQNTILNYNTTTKEITYGGGGGGGSAISSFQQLYTSSLSVSTINYTTSTIALGLDASRGTTQGGNAIAIGSFSGNNQARGAIAIGGFSAQGGNQDLGCVAIGYDAQGIGAGAAAIAIGAGAGWDGSNVNPQPATSIVINARGGFLTTTHTSSLTIAPIRNTPSGNLSTLQYNPTTSEITYTDAIGGSAISSFQQLYTSSFTTSTIQTASDGYISTNTVDAYYVSGNAVAAVVVLPQNITYQLDISGNDNINIAGNVVPNLFISSFNIGIGTNIGSGQAIAASGNIAIGYADPSLGVSAAGGNANQEGNNIIIGWNAGCSQSTFAVAIGGGAGSCLSSLATHSQGSGSVAIGGKSGGFYQNSISIPQGTFATAVGYQAQYGGSLNASLALGAFAGTTIQPASTIIMNATGAPLNGITGQQRSLYIAPIRNTVTGTLSTLQYNPTTKEVSYTNAGSGGSTAPGGTNGSIQYNNSGAFGGDSFIQYNSGTQALTVPHFSTNTIASAALTVSSIQVKGGVTGGYTTSRMDTNINIGDASYATSPNITIYPTDFIVGTSGTAARSISLVAGALTTGVTLISAGAVNITAATSINLLGAGVVDIGALGGVSIFGGGGVAITGGGAVVVTGGIGVSVAGGAGVVVAGGGGVAITGAGGILIGTAGGTGGGIVSYGGDIGIYEGVGAAGGNGRFDNTLYASTVQVSSINYQDYNLRLGSNAKGGDHTTNTGIIALGGDAYANANFAMAVGFGASTVGLDGVAIGHNTVSIGNQSIAIGREALASTIKAIAIGHSSYSMDNSIAIGYQAGSYSSINSVFIGKNTGQGTGANAVAIGSDANSLLVPAGSNRGTNTVAIGTNAMAAGSDNYSVCIGMNAGNSGVGSYVPANTIVITANQDPGLTYGLGAIPGQTHSLYISPIRNTVAGNLSTLAYNPATSEITYIPSGGGSVQISSFNDLYTSSLQVSSIQVGNRADVVGTPNKIIVFGGDSGQAGIFLSTVSGSGAGSSAGLYTNIIGSANGGNTLNITEVRTMYNSATTMELQGVSTINNVPYHSGAVSDPYNTLYSSTINSSNVISAKVNASSISCSTLTTFDSGGYVSTTLLNTSNIINVNLYTSTISTFNINFLNSNVLLGANNYPPPGGVSGAIAVGNNAMALGNSQISIGTNAGSNVAHAPYANSISIGTNAGIGINGSGSNSIFIGTNATQPGYGSAVNNSIFINASGTAPGSRLPHAGTYIMPVNNNSTINSSTIMFYDPTYGELSYGAPSFANLGVSSLYASTITTFNSGGYVSTSLLNSVSTIAQVGYFSSIQASTLTTLNSGGYVSTSLLNSVSTIAKVGYFSSINTSTINADIGVISSVTNLSSMNTYPFYAPTKCYTSTSVDGVYSVPVSGYKYLSMYLPTPVPNPLPPGIGYLITGNLNLENETTGANGDWGSYIKVNGNLIGVSTITTDPGNATGISGLHQAITVQALFSTGMSDTFPLEVALWFGGFGNSPSDGDMAIQGGTLTVLANV